MPGAKRSNVVGQHAGEDQAGPAADEADDGDDAVGLAAQRRREQLGRVHGERRHRERRDHGPEQPREPHRHAAQPEAEGPEHATAGGADRPDQATTVGLGDLAADHDGEARRRCRDDREERELGRREPVLVAEEGVLELRRRREEQQRRGMPWRTAGSAVPSGRPARRRRGDGRSGCSRAAHGRRPGSAAARRAAPGRGCATPARRGRRSGGSTARSRRRARWSS